MNQTHKYYESHDKDDTQSSIKTSQGNNPTHKLREKFCSPLAKQNINFEKAIYNTIRKRKICNTEGSVKSNTPNKITKKSSPRTNAISVNECPLPRKSKFTNASTKTRDSIQDKILSLQNEKAHKLSNTFQNDSPSPKKEQRNNPKIDNLIQAKKSSLNKIRINNNIMRSTCMNGITENMNQICPPGLYIANTNLLTYVSIQRSPNVWDIPDNIKFKSEHTNVQYTGVYFFPIYTGSFHYGHWISLYIEKNKPLKNCIVTNKRMDIGPKGLHKKR